MNYKLFTPLLCLIAFACTEPSSVSTSGPADLSIKSFCNPLDLSYRFRLEEPSRREAADPTIITFKGEYYLFASMSGGYWYSNNLLQWNFVETKEIPTEEYAPTAIAIGDTVYFLASSTEKSTIYQSTDPKSGQWSVAKEELKNPVWDPAFFMDEDEKLYLYWGCSNERPIYGVELDYQNNFDFIGETQNLIFMNPGEYGWEVPGDYNTRKDTNPWIEGPWMNKQDGQYYLQYAGPGTEFKSYSDAVYTSDKPLGPFELSKHNPFAYKPEGFAAGAGHGGTFQDEYGNYWHIGTITISQKHMFERRLGLFPTFIDDEGELHAITKYSDYPLMMPDRKVERWEDVFPRWMLLSYDKPVEVSSSIDSLPPSQAVDENIRTYWSAQSGGTDEWLLVDLEEACDVKAIQVNLAEHNTKLYDRQAGLKHQFVVEYSLDKKNWTVLVDEKESTSDNTHRYYPIDPVTARYVRISNMAVPDGHFALSGFRVFGHGNGNSPGEVGDLTVSRDASDRRSVDLSWPAVDNAQGYVISFGTNPEKLYSHYTVYADTAVTINILNKNQGYHFEIEAFNENGITSSTFTRSCE